MLITPIMIMQKMHLLRLSTINFATILRLTKIADRVGSSHFEFDPDEFKAKFEANKGKVYSETQKCFYDL